MSYAKLLRKIEEYIDSFYKEHPDQRLFYHTFSRITGVVTNAGKICRFYHLDDRSAFIVCAAAWFLDTGYLTGNTEAHEEKSAELAEHFLRNNGADEDDITEIKKCILATSKRGSPAGLPEKIVCDSNTFYLGTDRFKENRKLLRKELEAVKNIKKGRAEWLAESKKMLETHQYYTEYCKSLLDKTKEYHLNRLKNKQMEKLQAIRKAPVTENDIEEKQHRSVEPAQSKKTAAADKKPTRGIETMFRISSANSQNISEMADNKAHIMISVNTIIVSVVLGLLVGKLDENRFLLIPTVILLTFNVITIIYAVLATRPKVHPGTFTAQQLESKSVNLLFYGSFYNMDYNEYDTGMRQMMDDRDFLYGSLIKDIYWQGKVLGRKYKLLRTSYNIFMYGIAISVIAFTIAAFFHAR